VVGGRAGNLYAPACVTSLLEDVGSISFDRLLRTLSMTFIRLTALAVAALPVTLCAQQPDLDAGAGTITEADYMRRVSVMAHDSMAGRDTPSPGLEATASYVASEFERMGLSGGAQDGSFFQRYPLRRVVVDQERSYLQKGGVLLEFGADVIPIFGDVMNGESEAGIVLVSGSGDLAAGLADGAVRGRHVVLVLSSTSGRVDQGVYRTLVALINAGAFSVLLTNPSGDDAWAANAASMLRSEVSRGWIQDGQPPVEYRPVLQVRASAVARLIEGSGFDVGALQARSGGALRVDRVAGANLMVALRYAEEVVTAPNVVALIEGSDPALRGEYVVVSGHMDHVGIGLPDENGDSIYNGADDNASGTAAVIEIAEAVVSLSTPPRRSMMFLLVSGEEKGLWGSEYFAENSPVPVDRIVADLNMDMVGRNWSDTIVAIGKEHSDLGETLERVNAAHRELGMTAIDDLWPAESFYTRSDHYNFARQGVPILFFFNGTHEDYHGRDDEVDRIDAEKAARIARLVFYLGIEVANATARPEWNPDSYARIVDGPSGRASR
jgi:hypothetical protein